MNCNSLPQITGYRVTAVNMTLLVTYDFFKALESKLGKLSLTKDFFIAVEDGTNEVVGVSSPFRIQNGKTQTDIIIWGEDEVNIKDRSAFGVSINTNRYVSIYLLKGDVFYKIGNSVRYVTNYFAPLMANTSVNKYCTPNWTEESYDEYVNSVHDWWKSEGGPDSNYNSWLRGDLPSEYIEVFGDNTSALLAAKLEELIDSIDEPRFLRNICLDKPNLKIIHPTGDSHSIMITKPMLNSIESKVGVLDYDNDFFIAISNKTNRIVGISGAWQPDNTNGVASMAIWGQDSRPEISNEYLYNTYKDKIEERGNILDFGVPKLKDTEFTVLLLKDTKPKYSWSDLVRYKLYSIGNPIKYKSDGISILEGAVYEYCTLGISEAEYDEMQNDKWNYWRMKRPEEGQSVIDTPDLDYIEDVEDIADIAEPIDAIVEDLMENDIENDIENEAYIDPYCEGLADSNSRIRCSTDNSRLGLGGLSLTLAFDINNQIEVGCKHFGKPKEAQIKVGYVAYECNNRFAIIYKVSGGKAYFVAYEGEGKFSTAEQKLADYKKLKRAGLTNWKLPSGANADVCNFLRSRGFTSQDDEYWTSETHPRGQKAAVKINGIKTGRPNTQTPDCVSHQDSPNDTNSIIFVAEMNTSDAVSDNFYTPPIAPSIPAPAPTPAPTTTTTSDRYQEGFDDGVDSVDITADNQGFYNTGFSDGKVSVDITSDNDSVFNSGYNEGYGEGYSAVDITSDNQSVYDSGFDIGVDSVDITSDNKSVYDSGFDIGVDSVDITSDNQSVYDGGFDAGVGSVDITSDNQSVYDEAYQKGVASVDTTPQIVEVEKKKNNYAIPAIIGVVALFMLFGKK